VQYVHQDWNSIILNSQQNQNYYFMPENIKRLDHILKINQRIAVSVGQPYICYLSQIFNDLIGIYKVYSSNISYFLESNNNVQIVKSLKLLRRDILKLIQIYLEKEVDFSYFNTNFLPPLQEMVNDYTSSDPNSRDPETLSLFATVLKKEGNYIQGFLPAIL